MMRAIPLLSLGLLAGALLLAGGTGCGKAGKAPTPQESKAILTASDKGDAVQVETLVRANPGVVRAKDQSGATPLHFAIARGHTDVARKLLDAGADVNAKKSDGITPLHVAAALGRTEMARTLIDKGADPQSMDTYGHTPAGLAKERGHEETVSLLTADDEAMKEGRKIPRAVLGMPVYPGAHLYRHTVVSTVEVYAFVSKDGPDKVNAFYRKKLSTWKVESAPGITAYCPTGARFEPSIGVSGTFREWNSLTILSKSHVKSMKEFQN